MNVVTKKILLATAILFPLAIAPSPRAESAPLLAQVGGSANQNLSSFFETGRPRSEDTIRFQRPPRGVPPVRSDSRSWQFIVFRQGNVSFWMPPGILSQDQVLIATEAGDLTFRTLTATDGDYRYVAAHASGLTPQQRAEPAALFRAIRERVAPIATFSLTDERPITVGQQPGFEFTFASETESIIFRAYLVDDQLYVMGVVQPLAAPREQVVRAFLNALQFQD